MLKRYLRLYLYFVRFSFSKAMEFRLDFTFRIIMDIVFYAVQIGFFYVLYRHTETIGGWNFDQIFIFAASYMYLDAFHMTVFASNNWYFPIYVNRGDLDYYLVRPVSSLFFLWFKEFAANSFMNYVVATGLLIFALMRYPEALPFENIAVYLVFLHIGIMISCIMHKIFLIPVFWLHSIHGLREVSWQFERFTHRPDQIFTGWTRRILTSILPYAIMASFPVHLLFQGFNWEIAGTMLAVAAVSSLFLLWFWSRGLRAYSSASS